MRFHYVPKMCLHILSTSGTCAACCQTGKGNKKMYNLSKVSKLISSSSQMTNEKTMYETTAKQHVQVVRIIRKCGSKIERHTLVYTCRLYHPPELTAGDACWAEGSSPPRTDKCIYICISLYIYKVYKHKLGVSICKTAADMSPEVHPVNP